MICMREGGEFSNKCGVKLALWDDVRRRDLLLAWQSWAEQQPGLTELVPGLAALPPYLHPYGVILDEGDGSQSFI